MDPSSKGLAEIHYEDPLRLPEWTAHTDRVTPLAIASSD